VSRDDGVILRVQAANHSNDAWTREIIYAGPQGPRGIVAGRFDADPAVETIAVFGYSARVQLLSRRPGEAWLARTVFEDRDRGHWLAVAEVDGRNTTDEIICSGYGRRIILLSRPAGYGLTQIPTDPGPLAVKPEGESSKADPGTAKIGVFARGRDLADLSPLSYRGGFEIKTMVYETLVHQDEDGRIIPGLAAAWRRLDDDKTWAFSLRPDARFHDGTAVRAADVALHFRRWVGLPEHAWVLPNNRIESVLAPDDKTLLITLAEPGALLPYLCAINPTSVQAPGALDRTGHFIVPMGSGPYRVRDVTEDGRVVRLSRVDPPGHDLDFVRLGDDDLADLVRSQELDLLATGWSGYLDDETLEIARDAGYTQQSLPGSSVTYLSFNLDRGLSQDRTWRRTIADSIDRDQLAHALGPGRADPCLRWSAPGLSSWPNSNRDVQVEESVVATFRTAAPTRYPSAVLLLSRDEALNLGLGNALASSLEVKGIPIKVRAVPNSEYEELVRAGEFDLRLERTWGLPYDPHLSLVARFIAPPSRPTATQARYFGIDPRLEALVHAADATADEAARKLVYGRIQSLMDRDALIVPLVCPRRTVLRQPQDDLPELGRDLYRYR
ncbi:MAG: hypothetical protein KDB53_01220, partial [Planctomycetes bacterium]|nr:hypothetical protein [Planctomycetota bacterium]